MANRGAMPSEAPDVQRQRGRFAERRAFLARGIGEFVPAQRAEIHADVAENAERDVEAVAGIALGEQFDDKPVALVPQRRLDRRRRCR